MSKPLSFSLVTSNVSSSKKACQTFKYHCCVASERFSTERTTNTIVIALMQPSNWIKTSLSLRVNLEEEKANPTVRYQEGWTYTKVSWMSCLNVWVSNDGLSWHFWLMECTIAIGKKGHCAWILVTGGWVHASQWLKCKKVTFILLPVEQTHIWMF